MKASQILVVLGFSAISMAQTLAPSPTESYGCEPHADHWHCDGARATTGPAAGASTLSTAVPATTSAAEDHDHEDHDHEDHDDDHDDHSGTASLPPSPTGRGACSPHGDHWHCDLKETTTPASGASTNAAATTTAATTSAAASGDGASAAPSTTAVPAGAARAGFGGAAIAVAAALVAF